MRCGKDWQCCHTAYNAQVATRTNALWQRLTKTTPTQAQRVATRTNALWQRQKRVACWSRAASQPARMRCGKEGNYTPFYHFFQSQPARMRCGKVKRMYISSSSGSSQPARMRCGKVAPLLCPNQKLRKHELRSSFLISLSVILVVTFYMTAQLLKRFNTCTAKTAASKLSDAAVYSFNK